MKVNESELWNACEIVIVDDCQDVDDLKSTATELLSAIVSNDLEKVKDYVEAVRAELLKNINIEF